VRERSDGVRACVRARVYTLYAEGGGRAYMPMGSGAGGRSEPLGAIVYEGMGRWRVNVPVGTQGAAWSRGRSTPVRHGGRRCEQWEKQRESGPPVWSMTDNDRYTRIR
jgi:hypothetical protein